MLMSVKNKTIYSKIFDVGIQNIFVVSDHRLEHLVTEFAKSLPPKLLIHTKQLKIVESVGQGMCV